MAYELRPATKTPRGMILLFEQNHPSRLTCVSLCAQALTQPSPRERGLKTSLGLMRLGALQKQCASSKVAIAGDATRRPSWHWQAVSLSTSDGSYNRLTLVPAPTRRRKLYSLEIIRQRLCW